VWLSRAFTYNGDRASAAAERKKARELDSTLVTTRTVAVLDVIAEGRREEARTLVGHSVPPLPFTGMTANILERAGDKERAATIRKMLDSMPDTTWLVHTGRVIAYLAIPDTAKALDEMEAAVAHDEIIAQNIPFVDAIFDPVRQSPRFAEVLRRLGLAGRGLTGPTGGRAK
jgi:hypothetical protein